MIKKSKKISILITNYNKKNFLRESIESCLNQSEQDYEVIILDNFSSDGSDFLLKKYYKKCFIKKNKRISVYPALNQINLIKQGIKYCSGEIICFLDSDDYFYKNKIKIIKKIFETNSGISVVFDLPIMKSNNSFQKTKLKKFFRKKIWPTIISTSGISLKKKFLEKCIKNKFLDKYPLLEIDFRINALTRIMNFKYKIIDHDLTVYRSNTVGIMSKIKKYSSIWWIKRLQAHQYMKDKLSYMNKKHFLTLDYFLTRVVNFFLFFFITNKFSKNNLK